MNAAAEARYFVAFVCLVASSSALKKPQSTNRVFGGPRHGDAGALFRPVRNNRTGGRECAITPDGIYKLVRAYSPARGFEIHAPALRATAATNALDHQADINGSPRRHQAAPHLPAQPDAT